MTNNPRIKKLGSIGVLMGGYSSERAVSLRSGDAIYQALLRSGCQAKAIDIKSESREEISNQILKENIDLAFIALHGKLGEDGIIQSILEEMSIYYVGSGTDASGLALDKAKAHDEFIRYGIPCPASFNIFRGRAVDFEAMRQCLGVFPWVVKPACEGSSIGVSFVLSEPDCHKAVAEAMKFGDVVVVEKFIKGRELTVGILGQDVLPVIEVKPKNGFFDYESKYQKGMTEYLVPAPLNAEIASHVQQVALAAFNVLGCEDFGRVDVMLSNENQPYVLEINTIPGFTETSLLPKAAQFRGLSFEELCLTLVEMAYGKKEKNSNSR